jgi:phthalate 4,5-dioxygenase oxygenase subunit
MIMLTREKNELLCRIEGEAPMGQMMRRYWLPALTSSDLEAGGAPKRVRLLGEDLVAFRSPDGKVGLVDEYCPHRGASLMLARNEECGLRCIYHGWAIDAQGTVVETPAEPAESKLKERVRSTAYPVHELGGVVWAYMGPAGEAPRLPDFEFTGMPADQVMIMRSREECNWAQCQEGVIDSAHSNYLHSNGIKPKEGLAVTSLGEKLQFGRPSNDGAPKLEVETQPYGFRYAALRKPLQNPEQNRYVRVTLYVAPCFGIIPAPKGLGMMQFFVPIDDTHTMFYYVFWSYDKPFDQQARDQYAFNHGLRVGVDMDENFRKIRTRSNNWMQDREAMKRGETFSGIFGINVEDFAVQESMGPVFDRTKEHLGASDLAVIHFRRLILDAVERFVSEGAAPPGLAEHFDYGKLRGAEGMVPHSEPWQSVLGEGAPKAAAE